MACLGVRPADLLETIFDQVLIAVVVIDEDHRIVYANDPALKIFGVSRTALANPLRVEDFLSPYRVFDSTGNEIGYDRLPIFRALAGQAVEPYTEKLLRPDGSFKWLHMAAHHFSAMGLSGALLVATDETREVELQRIAANIQKVEVLSALAGALAYNFNNILEVINLTAVAGVESSEPGSRARFQQILDASRHASDLTKRLAQFSRTQELKSRPTSINQLVKNAVALIEPLIFSNIQVITSLHPDLPGVEVDPVQIEQVMFNLMLNARDAMPNGGQLTIATYLGYRPLQNADGDAHEQCVIITVSDTGSGIPKELAELIFEPFFTTKPKGTGLGLASAQGIVRQHRGDIKVQSEVGSGAQFTLYLPVSSAKSPSAELQRFFTARYA